MTFKIYTDTGETYGPFGSLPLAQKHARAIPIRASALRIFVDGCHKLITILLTYVAVNARFCTSIYSVGRQFTEACTESSFPSETFFLDRGGMADLNGKNGHRNI
jgi:hypothetical protein